MIENWFPKFVRVVVLYPHAEFHADPFKNEGARTFFKYFAWLPMEVSHIVYVRKKSTSGVGL